MYFFVLFIFTTLCEMVTVIKTDANLSEMAEKCNIEGVMVTSNNINFLVDYLKRNNISCSRVIGWNGTVIDMVLRSDASLTPYDLKTNPCSYSFVVINDNEEECTAIPKEKCKWICGPDNEPNKPICNPPLKKECQSDNACNPTPCFQCRRPINDCFLRSQIRDPVQSEKSTCRKLKGECWPPEPEINMRPVEVIKAEIPCEFEAGSDTKYECCRKLWKKPNLFTDSLFSDCDISRPCLPPFENNVIKNNSTLDCIVDTYKNDIDRPSVSCLPQDEQYSPLRDSCDPTFFQGILSRTEKHKPLNDCYLRPQISKYVHEILKDNCKPHYRPEKNYFKTCSLNPNCKSNEFLERKTLARSPSDYYQGNYLRLENKMINPCHKPTTTIPGNKTASLSRLFDEVYNERYTGGPCGFKLYGNCPPPYNLKQHDCYVPLSEADIHLNPCKCNESEVLGCPCREIILE